MAGSLKPKTYIWMAALVAAIAVGVLLGIRFAGDNFHTVVAGEVYRSAQPSPEAIRRFHTEQKIATIINLRGENAGTGWYDDEVKAARDLGINHIDFRMSAHTELTPDEARQLIALMRDAPKPLLIHCKAGADRTGLASALYLAAIAKQGEAAAEGQLSLRFGHVALPWIGTIEMDWTFEAMEPELGFIGS